MTTRTNKTFKLRGSATDLLKKMGITKGDYAKYLTSLDGATGTRFEVTLVGGKPVPIRTVETVPSPHDDAAKHLAKLFGGKPVGTAKPAAKTKTTKVAKVTVSTVARELIVAGKTNDEVWSVISKQFSLDAGKRGYPAWYRSDCKKKGLIK